MNVKLDCAALFLQQILKETAVNLGFFFFKKKFCTRAQRDDSLKSCSAFLKSYFSLNLNTTTKHLLKTLGVCKNSL